MKIDFMATRKNLEIFKLNKLALSEGFSPETVRQVVNEVYACPNGPKAMAVIAMLRRRGFLVEVEDDSQSQAA